MSRKEEIIEKALLFIGEAPKGIRYTMLVEKIAAALPDIPKNTIHGTVWNLEIQLPDRVIKPARGLYLLAKYRTNPLQESPARLSTKVKEEDLFQEHKDFPIHQL